MSRNRPDFWEIRRLRGLRGGGSGGAGFLHSLLWEGALGSFNSTVNANTVDQELGYALMEALGHGHGLSLEELDAKTTRVRAMFETMPKNGYGRINRDALEYMVLRYFGAEHGWTLKGFDDASRANASKTQSATIGDATKDSTATQLRERLPAYVESVIEDRLDQHGFGLNDVVTFLVVLERLISDERLGMLEDAYYLQKKETEQLLTRKQMVDVSTTYMLIY